MSTVQRMHWLLATSEGFDLFTDHQNLIFIFDPLSVIHDLVKSTVRKVLRWAVLLSAYTHICVHIKGLENVWADILSRWTPPATIRRLVKIPVLPSSSDEDFAWPTASEISKEQEKHGNKRPEFLTQSDGLWKNPIASIWIPEQSDDLHLRLCVIAHTSSSGHRAHSSTEKILRKSFFWSTLSADVRTFVHSCIHCLCTSGGGKVPRPFGPSVHGTNPNSLLQFDYIEIAPSTTEEKYVLMLRDDRFDYKWVFSFTDTKAQNAATAIIDWLAAFGVPKGLMSDGPTHFKNETIRLLNKQLKVPHHFTLPYSPWSSGAIERLGKELLKVFRPITSDLQIRSEEWPDLLPVVQSVLNNSPSSQRGDIAPVKAFTGMDATPPISTFLRSSTLQIMTVQQVCEERFQHVKELQKVLEDLHTLVQESLHSNRE